MRGALLLCPMTSDSDDGRLDHCLYDDLRQQKFFSSNKLFFVQICIKKSLENAHAFHPLDHDIFT